MGTLLIIVSVREIIYYSPLFHSHFRRAIHHSLRVNERTNGVHQPSNGDCKFDKYSLDKKCLEKTSYKGMIL
jgi:hypothetical protein